jgi:hypothetical protein
MTIMATDPIVAEVRAAREKLFNECHNDLSALLDRFQVEQQKTQPDAAPGQGIAPKSDGK